MTLWLILAAITLVAVAVLLLPLLRRAAAPAPRSAYDLSVYRQQFVEIDRDLERGLLTEGEAGAARTEVERRMLQAADHSEDAGTGGDRGRPIAAIAIAVLLPVAAFLAYHYLGAPQLVDRERLMAALSQSGRDAERAPLPGLSPEQQAEVEAMVGRLAERAMAAPDDLEVWLRLGQAYGVIGRPAQAVEAFREALRISGGRPDVAAEYGESLVMLHQGEVVAAAREVFNGVLADEPREPRARYYLGLAAAQDGDWPLALERWTALAEDSTPDAPWLRSLRQRIADAALALGRDPASLPIIARLDAKLERAAEAQAQSEVDPAQIEAMVAGLAARLEAEPDDLQGWLMLLRSYRVLGREAQLAESLERARAVFAGRPEALSEIERLAEQLGLSPEAPRAPAPASQ